MSNLLIRSLAKSVFVLLAACPPVVWAESVERECTTDTFARLCHKLAQNINCPIWQPPVIRLRKLKVDSFEQSMGIASN